MCTHLKIISTCISTDPSRSIQRAIHQTGNGIRIPPKTSYSNEKWNMCTHLKLISSLISTDPSRYRERTTRQAMTSGCHRRLATAMRSGIDLHAHSPKFNLPADIRGSVSVQRAQPEAVASAYRKRLATAMRSGIWALT